MKIPLRRFIRTEEMNEQECRRAAAEIWRWTARQKISGENGVLYRINPGGVPDLTGGPVFGRYSLYSGSAGIGIFLLRLFDVSGDRRYLEEARSIADQFLDDTPGSSFYRNVYEKAPASALPVTGWHMGVYSGPAGQGIFTLELYRETGEEKYLAFAQRLGADLLLAGETTENGIRFSGDTDCFSDGGFILYFLSLYRAAGRQSDLEAARSIASEIHARRLEDGRGGAYWNANDLSRVGMPKGSIYPGFSHGTAGIGYAMAALYEADRQEWQLDDAVKAAVFLQSISDRTEDGVLIPYLWGAGAGEEWQGKYYLGFCHGPAGTSLLFRKLYDLTGEGRWKDFAEALSSGILDAGAPENNSWGFWNSYCLCCGTPGLIEHFAEMYEWTGKEEHLEYARRSAARVLRDSTLDEQGGRSFYGYWDRTDPRDVQTYTGLYVGAAGAGAALLRLASVLEERDITPLFEYGYLRPLR